MKERIIELLIGLITGWGFLFLSLYSYVRYKNEMLAIFFSALAGIAFGVIVKKD